MQNIDHYIGRSTGREATYRHQAKLLRKQWEQATSHTSGGGGVVVECVCGRARPIELLFRCYHCGLWFCDECSPIHFGEERASHGRE